MEEKRKANITPGEAAGIVAAQSLGEPGTQMTMRTFHYAGMREVVPAGLPRMIEIVDARRTPKKPVIYIYLKTRDERKAREMVRQIEEVSLKEVALIAENFPKKIIMMKINRKRAEELGIDLADLKKVVKETAKEYEFKTEKEIMMIRGKKETYRKLRKITNKLTSLIIKGVKGIKKAVLIKEKNGFCIMASGSNLSDVLSVPDVDVEKCYVNDIHEIEEIFGIEAARAAIVKELEYVMSAQGLSVDSRHIRLLADAMCASGSITSIGRHGLSGKKASVLARAAFEETIKHIITAAIRGEKDELKGVTENILIGQRIPLGTGTVRLRMAR